MGWLQIVLLVLSLLKDLKKSESVEAFAASPSGSRFGDRGDLLKWIWENREEVVAFVLQIVELFKKQPEVFGSTDGDDLLKSLIED